MARNVTIGVKVTEEEGQKFKTRATAAGFSSAPEWLRDLARKDVAGPAVVVATSLAAQTWEVLYNRKRLLGDKWGKEFATATEHVTGWPRGFKMWPEDLQLGWLNRNYPEGPKR